MMENFKVFKIILLFVLTFALMACQEPGLFEPQADQNTISFVENEVIEITGNDKDKDKDKDNFSYPLHGKMDLFWNADSSYYEGGKIQMEDGTKFHVKSDALIPPKNLIKYFYDEEVTYSYSDDMEIASIRKQSQKRKPVRITMRIDKDEEKNELIYTFGPHGSKFSKPARIVFDYSSLGIDIANLFYIEDDGSYTEQPYDQINIKNKKIYLYINHFSRYAMSYGN